MSPTGTGLRRALLVGALAAGWSGATVAGPPEAARPLTIPLRIRVALCPEKTDGPLRPVRADPWLDEHLQAAEALLAPHGIGLRPVRETFTPSRCEALTRGERDAFAAHLEPDHPGPTVLVVARVRDLDVPSYDLQGVHWRAGGKRWVFLTARASPPTLAHEIGHYFGLGHDPKGGNLMTPGPSSPLWRSPRPPRPFAPRLTPAQAKKLRAAIAAQAAASEARR